MSESWKRPRYTGMSPYNSVRLYVVLTHKDKINAKKEVAEVSLVVSAVSGVVRIDELLR